MIKRIIIGTLIVILLGAVGVGAYDAYQGNSTLSLPDVSLSQINQGQERGQGHGQGQSQGQGQDQQGQGQGQQGHGQGQGRQGQGQGQQGQGQGQGKGRHGQNQGQGQGNQAQGGNESGMPQAMNHNWITLTGIVLSGDLQQGIIVDSQERGQLSLSMGRPGFASEQEVTFSPGDAVTIFGFEDEGNMFQVGQITNDTTGATLYLRDPNGRPLWAGQGQRQGKHQ